MFCLNRFDIPFVGALAGLFYIGAVVCAVLALWRSRTPQGATSWIVGLLSFPFIVVPLFLVFGRNKFFGYVRERKQLDTEAQRLTAGVEALYSAQVRPDEKLQTISSLVAKSRQLGFLPSNHLELLVNAEVTYQNLLEAMEHASKYILFQFYIFRTDSTGQRFAELLKRKAREGVRVYFLYDEIGQSIPKSFLRDLRNAGVQASVFMSTKGWKTGLQVNFRNHRKIVVVDGRVAFLGGINIGDDYLGLWPSIGPWRDTHVRLSGPSAMATQIPFIKDWYWATGTIPEVEWTPSIGEEGSGALVLHTGPADDTNLCLLSHLTLINGASQRIWISNPYFVPPEPIEAALTLAVSRGVDVRVITPLKGDNRWVMYAAQVYEERMLQTGVKLFKYVPGYAHQKILLVDDIAVVGSVNMDPRSFFINFEVMAVSSDSKFVSDVTAMLERDFSRCQEFQLEQFSSQPLWKKMRARAVALASPIL